MIIMKTDATQEQIAQGLGVGGQEEAREALERLCGAGNKIQIPIVSEKKVKETES